jgi:ATP-dependent helicase/nuclease subunit A
MKNAKPFEKTPQTEASDPLNSVWVSANAGSGKTTVLVQRVIRLLLRNVPPSRILCLTYTKAAAAHMANEILKKLSAWVRLDDEALDAVLASIDSHPPDAARRALARRLFSNALETPGGLKVQTIHAFCDRVLHMFPVEGGAPAGFAVIDEYTERDLIERARTGVMLDAGLYPDSETGRAFALCIEACGDDAISATLLEAVRERQMLLALGGSSVEKAIRTSLGLAAGVTAATIADGILNGKYLPRAQWGPLANALAGFSGNAEDVVAKLLQAHAAEPDEALDIYLSIFVTDKGTLRTDGGFGNKDVREKAGDIYTRLLAERDRLAPEIEKLRVARECERSLALLTLADAVIERYERSKRQRGALDFADLVTKTVDLLEREASAWVHFKLDGGIEHILVDEAQDTSPEQWRIIGKLAEEFFAGKGASDYARTIFAVGDEKQSIFSFQGADPKRFEDMRVRFETLISATGASLSKPRLQKSYRSVDVVLKAVDKVFADASARRGLSAHVDEKPLHEAVRANAPGMVEIWPLVQTKNGSDDNGDGWQAPLDSIPENAAVTMLARQIAKAVRHWIYEGGLSVGTKNFGGEEKREPARAGDIVILVQRRGALFESILRALKQARIPVAGADRLVLTDHIAVMDLMALGDALLLERDDLQLASVLKSPLFGFDDDDLLTLAHDREGTLAASLISHSGSDARYGAAANTLARWREEALHLRPFDLYSRVLTRDEGRKKMIARLGPEASDALDEFLAQALTYEATETPSLQGFIGYLRRTGAIVKRDLETASDAVRVMTTHGVKGLEAPVVVLADTTARPFERHHPKLMPMVAPNDPEDRVSALVWALKKDSDSKPLSDARERALQLRDQEYRRLLYVALTRAADVLVVAGYLNKNQKEAPATSWYGLIDAAITKNEEEKPHLTKHQVPYCGENITRWRTPAFEKVAAKPVPRVPAVELVDWLDRGDPHEKISRAKLRPSFAPRSFRERRAAAENEGARERGILLHRLLQSLPDLALGDREAAGLRFLKQAAPELADAAKASLVKEALAVINDPACAEIFAAGSRAEPELIARIQDGAREIEIAARLDRLLVTEKKIVFADFKSDALVPNASGEIPAHYFSQLSAYRAALAQAFPGRQICALLIFTAAPRVFEIPEESLKSAWQRLKMQGSLAPA